MVKEIKVGITVAVAIAVVIFGLRWLGGWRASHTRQHVEIEFTNGGGLQKADRVFVHGVLRGRVDDILLTEDGVLVRVWLESDVTLKEDATAEIDATGFLGGARVFVNPGQSARLYDFSSPIQGKPGVDLASLMAAASHVLEITDEILKTVSNEFLSADDLRRMRKILSALDEGTRDFKTSASELRRLLGSNRETLAHSIQRIEAITQTADSLLFNLREGKGTAGKLLADEELYTEFVEGIRELRALIKDIKSNPRRYFRLF
jgi:phospholipid/cholesterol/gamma-HCH transport system substrate-binding protein